ncbi:carboxymuconolactone decarboxylase family protein [Streptacidiphilus sp. PAMC 29251]
MTTTTDSTSTTTTTTKQDRYEVGLKVLQQIDGEAGQRVVDAMADVSPELGHQVVAWAFGDMYARPELAPRDRQLVTLGVLTALGGCEIELEVHINAALNIGLTPVEISEVLLHAAVYCGMPRAINATLVAKKVFGERDLLPVCTLG